MSSFDPLAPSSDVTEDLHSFAGHHKGDTNRRKIFTKDEDERGHRSPGIRLEKVNDPNSFHHIRWVWKLVGLIVDAYPAFGSPLGFVRDAIWHHLLFWADIYNTEGKGIIDMQPYRIIMEEQERQTANKALLEAADCLLLGWEERPEGDKPGLYLQAQDLLVNMRAANLKDHRVTLIQQLVGS